jgi:hypothetical protein
MEIVTKWFGGATSHDPRVAGPPSVRIENPLSDEAYSGRITVKALARNAAAVSYRVDEEPHQAMHFNASSGLWEAALETSTLRDGLHNVTVVAEGYGLVAQDRAWNILVVRVGSTPTVPPR